MSEAIESSAAETSEPRAFVIPDTPAESVPAQTPAAEAPAAPPADPASGEAKPTDGQPEKQGKSRFERRLDRAYRAKAEAEARAEFFQRQLEEAKQAAQPKAPQGSPRLEDFPDVESYANAKVEFETRERFKALSAQQQQIALQAQQRAMSEAWAEKSARGESKYDDFEEKVGELKPTTPWGAAIIRAPNGDDIAYHLASHMKEAERIAQLDPVDQIMEIGMLGAKLLADPPKAKKVSSAPAPITPVTGASTTPNSEPSDSDDIGTWIRKRQKQVHGR